MVDAAKRRSLIDRIVTLNGGGEDLRELFSAFTDDDLVAAVARAEAIGGRGTLEGKWRDVGDRLLTDEVAGDRAA